MTTTTASTDPALAAELTDRNRPRRPATRRGGRNGGINVPLTVVMAVLSLTVLVPLYVTVVMSLKSTAQAVDGNAFSLPTPIDLSGFAQAWTLTNFPRAFMLSLFISVASVAGAILLSTMASFAIIRNWDRKLFRFSFFYLLAAMFIPFPVVALTQIKLTAFLSLDNPIGVAILHIMFQVSFSVLLCSAFLRSLPEELEESARIDGCTTNQLFWRLVFPLLAPISATIGIFAFLASWNDYMMPNLITADPALQTIPVVQAIFQGQFSTNYNVSFASYLMAMAPTIIVYIFAQRWVMSGVTQGAIK